MIEMKFYRDDEYVYLNNPDGTTKRATIEDFEKVFSGSSGGDIMRTTMSPRTQTLDKTWKEINDAIVGGKFVYIYYNADGETPEYYFIGSTVYADWDDPPIYTLSARKIVDPTTPIIFKAETQDSHPKLDNLT